MDKRDKYIKQITRSLTILKYEIEALNKINLTDYNIIAEDFYRDLLVFYGYELENLNEQKKNADSIDLVDKKNKIAIQVTSRNDTTKIHDTIKGFYSNPDYDEYKRLIILLVGKSKLEYSKTDFTKGNLFYFDKKEDIIDINDIIKKFSSYKAEQLEPIVEFLESEIDFKINTKSTKSNEVITIIKMIEYLSDDNNYKKTEINETSDPDNKRLRFTEHFDFLMTRYERLLSLYTGALAEAKSYIDGVRVNKINVFLQNLSNDYLIKYSNNPKDALNELVNYFETEISSSITNYDKMAIEFYLLDELINCNVFPNPKE
ncbi:MAG: SMEK domain-containing protein [Chlorobi bacterium]|nr:SMEK domain-containing protein [Chlorobiota bacterium]